MQSVCLLSQDQYGNYVIQVNKLCEIVNLCIYVQMYASIYCSFVKKLVDSSDYLCDILVAMQLLSMFFRIGSRGN